MPRPSHGRCYGCKKLTAHFVRMLGMWVCDTCSPFRTPKKHAVSDRERSGFGHATAQETLGTYGHLLGGQS